MGTRKVTTRLPFINSKIVPSDTSILGRRPKDVSLTIQGNLSQSVKGGKRRDGLATRDNLKDSTPCKGTCTCYSIDISATIEDNLPRKFIVE